jgi:hypothetical protein
LEREVAKNREDREARSLPHVEYHRRAADDKWLIEICDALDATVTT